MTSRSPACCLLLALAAHVASGAAVVGHVFADRNGNGKLDTGDRGLEGVLVSAWNRTTRTDAKGAYRLELVAGDHVVHPAWPDGVWPAATPYWRAVTLGGNSEETADFPMVRRTTSVPFYAAQLTDTHAARDQADRMAKLCESIDSFRKAPAFVVNTGDLGSAASARSDAEAEANWTRDYLPCVKPLKAPLLHTCGSGDYGGARTAEWTGPKQLAGRGGFRRYCGPLNHAFSAGGWHFIFIEVAVPRTPPSAGVALDIPPETLTWLKAYLETVSRWEPKALFCHARPDETTSGGKELEKLLKGKDFRAIFVGHDHKIARFKFADIPGFVTGAASGTDWVSHNLSGDAQGYRVIEFERNRAVTSAYVSPWREHHIQVVSPAPHAVLRGKVEVRATVFDPTGTLHTVRLGVRSAITSAPITRHGPFKVIQTDLETDRMAEGAHDLWVIVQRLDRPDTVRVTPIRVVRGEPKPFRPMDTGRLHVRGRGVDVDAAVLVNGQKIGALPAGVKPERTLIFDVPEDALARANPPTAPFATVSFLPGKMPAGEPDRFDVADILIRYDGSRCYDLRTAGGHFVTIESVGHLDPPSYEARILLEGEPRHRPEREPGKEFTGGYYVRIAVDRAKGSLAVLRARYATLSREPRAMSLLIFEGEKKKILFDVQVEQSFAALTHTFFHTPWGSVPPTYRADLVMINGSSTTSLPARPTRE